MDHSHGIVIDAARVCDILEAMNRDKMRNFENECRVETPAAVPGKIIIWYGGWSMDHFAFLVNNQISRYDKPSHPPGYYEVCFKEGGEATLPLFVGVTLYLLAQNDKSLVLPDEVLCGTKVWRRGEDHSAPGTQTWVYKDPTWQFDQSNSDSVPIGINGIQMRDAQSKIKGIGVLIE